MIEKRSEFNRPLLSEKNILTRLHISYHDLAIARSAATFLLEEFDDKKEYELLDQRKFRCYETTMIVAYARPFSQSRGQVKPLKLTDIDISLSKLELDLHKKLIWHRNKLYSHSDSEFVDFETFLLNVSLDIEKENFEFIIPGFSEKLRLPISEVLEFHKLTGKLIHQILLDIQKLALKFRSDHWQIDV